MVRVGFLSANPRSAFYRWGPGGFVCRCFAVWKRSRASPSVIRVGRDFREERGTGTSRELEDGPWKRSRRTQKVGGGTVVGFVLSTTIYFRLCIISVAYFALKVATLNRSKSIDHVACA